MTMAAPVSTPRCRLSARDTEASCPEDSLFTDWSTTIGALLTLLRLARKQELGHAKKAALLAPERMEKVGDFMQNKNGDAILCNHDLPSFFMCLSRRFCRSRSLSLLNWVSSASRMYSSRSIRIRWKEPEHHPHTVVTYSTADGEGMHLVGVYFGEESETILWRNMKKLLLGPIRYTPSYINQTFY